MGIKEITFDKDRYHEAHLMHLWCNDQFGPMYEKWWSDTAFGKTTFSFEEERDYNWFVMRWS